MKGTVRTISLSGSELRVDDCRGSYVSVKNDGTEILYISSAAGIAAGAEGVMPVGIGEAALYPRTEGALYLKGSGNAVLVFSDQAVNFFKPAVGGSAGGADLTARQEINEINDPETGILAQSKAYTLESAVRPNLLINSDFRVNQRGASGTVTQAGYFVDRWKLESGSVTIQQDGSLLLDGTISQKLESPAGAVVSVSSDGGTPVYDDAQALFTLTAAGERISFAKLEQCSYPTAYIHPDPTAELSRCQRFYVRYSGKYKHIGCGYVANATMAVIIVPLMQSMRSSPVVTLEGTVYINAYQFMGSNAAACTKFASDYYTCNAAMIPLTLPASAPAVGYGCSAQFRDDTSALVLNAEL